MQPTVIAPSILSANFARLGEEVDAVLAAGADWVHFDVMDNHYVPNLTIGPLVCSALRKHGVTAPIDVHLMVQPVDRIVPDFAEAGASVISFHPEASSHVHRTIQLIKSLGCQAGLVLNPATPVDVLDWVLEDLDLVLLMSVNPGRPSSPRPWTSCAKCAGKSTPAAGPSAWKSTAGSRPTILSRLRPRARILSSPVRPSLMRRTMRR